MDYHEVMQLPDKQIELAGQYAESRDIAGQSKKDLDILLAAVFSSIRSKKSNVGYEVALIMLMEDNKIARELYAKMIEHTARYKGLEKLIEAHQDKISLAQSVMKYGRGDGYGVWQEVKNGKR